MLRQLDHLEEHAACLLLVGLGLLLTVQIAMRYLLGLGYGWMEELARVAFVWVIYLGAIVGMTGGLHIRVSLGLQLFPPAARPWAAGAGDLILLLFCAAFTWHGIELLKSTVDVPFTLSATGISMFWAYLIIPVSFGLQGLRLALRHLTGRQESDGV